MTTVRSIVVSNTTVDVHGVDDRFSSMIRGIAKDGARLPIVSTWDPAAFVYVTVGPDMEPGAATVDDDGTGVVDDRGELGATGTDDQVLTPGDDGYDDAEAGTVTASVFSRGAMRQVEGNAVIQGPGQVRIDMLDDGNRLTSRIIDLVR